MCECHDTDTEHESWFEQKKAYWSAYFGNAVHQAAETERLLAMDDDQIID
jgi:hypothetical protein